MEKLRFHQYFRSVWICQTKPLEAVPFTLSEIRAKYPFPNAYAYVAPSDGVLQVVKRTPRPGRAAAPKVVKGARAAAQAGKAPQPTGVSTTPTGRNANRQTRLFA
jgi:hypothetical protein